MAVSLTQAMQSLVVMQALSWNEYGIKAELLASAQPGLHADPTELISSLGNTMRETRKIGENIMALGFDINPSSSSMEMDDTGILGEKNLSVPTLGKNGHIFVDYLSKNTGLILL